ncbi:MAG: hypothetical protein LH647_08375 [Leptolyngbyaceae cyanobacterium CAN_BIN12]|nr:hypothetical protein [Leptolyngbyaceae cyanobacterium CAN_BIN12]
MVLSTLSQTNFGVGDRMWFLALVNEFTRVNFKCGVYPNLGSGVSIAKFPKEWSL